MDWVDPLIACSINTYMMIWSDFEFVIHLACIIKTRILDIIWPCLLIIMIMTWLFSGLLFICALVVSFAALTLRARAANDTTRAQINNIPSKSHVIPLLERLKALQTWPHCCRQIVADANVSPFARARNICCEHKFCVRDTKKVPDFVQKHFVSATNVSQFAQHGNTTFILCPAHLRAQETSWATMCPQKMCPRLPGPWAWSLRQTANGKNETFAVSFQLCG